MLTESYQYIEYYKRAGRLSFGEYYDLASDPWHLSNLLTDERRSNDPPRATLVEQLRRDKTCSARTCP